MKKLIIFSALLFSFSFLFSEKNHQFTAGIDVGTRIGGRLGYAYVFDNDFIVGLEGSYASNFFWSKTATVTLIGGRRFKVFDKSQISPFFIAGIGSYHKLFSWDNTNEEEDSTHPDLEFMVIRSGFGGDFLFSRHFALGFESGVDYRYKSPKFFIFSHFTFKVFFLD